MSSECTIIDFTSNNSSVSVDGIAAGQAASEESTTASPIASTNADSPFLKLPGELRNRIYCAYFEDFEEQMSRRFVNNPVKMTPKYLALMHINRKLRSEAGSIFWKEIAPFHRFSCPTDQPIEAVMLSRIRDVCALVSIHDVHMSISVHCTPIWEEITGENAWKYGRDVKRLMGQVLVRDGHNPAQPGWRCQDTWRHSEVRCSASLMFLNVSRDPAHRKLSMQQLRDVHDSWTSNASDRTSGARARTHFLVKYQDEGVREGENFVYIEGPLAEVEWRKKQAGFSF